AHLRARCHAVLALLSEGYPPPRGRLPTRYSPVCHSTHGRSRFRVRLACVRHAASVDSEPGSNSHVKTVGSAVPREHNRLTRAPVDWLCVVVCRKWDGSMAARRHHSHPADTSTGCAVCVLSSFQRTKGCPRQSPGEPYKLTTDETRVSTPFRRSPHPHHLNR